MRSRYTWTYDVFGNRVNEDRLIATEICGASIETAEFGSDNALRRRAHSVSCLPTSRYWSDRTGNRLIQIDTSHSGLYMGAGTVMSYTAKSQLYFSVTPQAMAGSWDYNWHWYDASGMRIMTHVQGGQQLVPGDFPAPNVGTRNYYFYDGSDVAIGLVRNGSTWWVRQRFITGGVDEVIAGRFAQNLTASSQNLILINDRQGTTLAAVRADGTQETQTVYFSRNPFGSLESSGSGGSLNTETGFTGASTPNQTGVTYLRNRWYDPQTGRFLTQDPIGLAGGVNLYSYAGNNPVTFTDPFGLCPWHDIECWEDKMWAASGGYRLLWSCSRSVGINSP